MIDRLILLCFGGIFIASIFMLSSFFRMARMEHRDAKRHGTPLRYDRPFLLALYLCVGACSLIGVSAIRTLDGLAGRPLGGSSPLGLAISLAMLWIAWSGFHWAATFDRARYSWRAYLGLIGLWALLVAWPLLGI